MGHFERPFQKGCYLDNDREHSWPSGTFCTMACINREVRPKQTTGISNLIYATGWFYLIWLINKVSVKKILKKICTYRILTFQTNRVQELKRKVIGLVFFFENAVLQQIIVNLTGIRKCPGYNATVEGLPTGFLYWIFLTVGTWIFINAIYENYIMKIIIPRQVKGWPCLQHFFVTDSWGSCTSS